MSKKLAEKPTGVFHYEALEQRLLFSADALPGVENDTAEEPAIVEDVTKDAREQAEASQEAQIAAQFAEETRWELVIVNENVADYEKLINDLQNSDAQRVIEVVTLAENANGIDQVTEVLAARQDLAAIHVISHGSEGQINLGSDWLNSNTLQQNSTAVASWGQALTDNGDILFYGCNIAGNSGGQSLLDDIAQLTGADVAASDDTTGHTRLGGDWDLEATSGVVETSVAVSTDAQTDWQGLLAETIYTSYENAPDTNEVKSDTHYGQTFSHDSGSGTYNVNQLSLLLWKDADATSQNITISLRSSWDGSDLGSATIASSALSTTSSWETFDIGNISLTDGATYYIRVYSDSIDGKIWLGCDASGTYADGDQIDVNGLPLSGEDLAFRVVESTTEPSSNGIAIWAESGSSMPETSVWNGTDFGAESTAVNTDEWRIMQGAEAPARDEKILVGITSSNTVTGMMHDGSSWSSLSLGTLGTVSESYWWGADVAYESQSGDAVLVWNDNSQSTGDKLRFSVWDGSNWSTPASITAYSGSEPQQMKLASNPNSDEMVLVISDRNADDHVLVWDGAAWGNAQMIDSSGSGENDQSGISVAYEAQSGHAMVVYGHDGDADLYYRTWDGSNWSNESSLAAPGGVSSQTNWTTLASDPNTDRIAVSVQTTGADVWLCVWDGNSWETPLLAETNATGTIYPDSAVAFESQSGQAMTVYGQSGESAVRYRTWSSADGWSNAQTGPNVGSTPNSMTLDSDPGSDAIMLSVQDSGSDLNLVQWDGSAWGSVTEHETNTGETKNQPFVFLWDQDVNQAPINTVPAAQTISQDETLTFSSVNGNAITVTDADAGSSAIEVTLGVTNGTLTLNTTAQPDANETTVNSNPTGSQFYPDIAYAADGSSIIVWEDGSQDGSLSGIYFQRFDTNGNPVGGETLANTTTDDFQVGAAVAMNDNGSFVIVWESFGQDKANGYGVFGQIFDNTGAKVGSEFQVNTQTGDDQVTPDVVMDSSGNVTVVWYEDKTNDVKMRRFDNTGTALGGEVVVNTETGDTQSNPGIAINSSGDTIVVWQSDHVSAGNFEIYGQRYDNTGASVGTNFQINTTTTEGQSYPDVALNDDGTFVVVWESLWQDANPGWGVYGQIFNASAVKVGPEFIINQEVTDTQAQVKVAADSNGNFTATWHSNQQDGDSYGIYARQFDASGAALTDEFMVNTTTAGSQSAPAIAMSGDGSMTITWCGNQTGNMDIYAQRYQTPTLTFSSGDGADDAVMTFTGTIADINLALEGLVYSPSNGFNGDETLTITTDDLGNTGTGGNLTDVDTVSIAVGNPNAPVLDLDADNSSGQTGADYAVSWTEGGGAVGIVDSDAILTDGDGNITSITVTITNLRQAGVEYLDADTTGTSLIKNYIAGTGVLTISGSGSTADFQQVLRTVTYDNTSDTPDTTARVITFTPSDALSNGNMATTTVTLAATNDAPVNTVPGAQSTGQDTDLIFSTGNGNAVTVGDVDAGGNDLQVTLSVDNGTLTLNTTAPVGAETTGNITTTGLQGAPTVAYAPDGSYVMVWQDSNNLDGDDSGIFAQRYGSDGSTIGSEFQVNTTTSSFQFAPSIAMDDAGNFVVSWTHRTNGGSTDIYAQRFNDSGVAQGSEFVVNDGDPTNQHGSSVAMNGNGDFVVVWYDNGPLDDEGIVMKRFDNAGNQVGSELQVNTTLADDQQYPEVSIDDSGNIVVVWQSNLQDGSGFGIYTQRYDASNTPQGGETLVNTTTANSQTYPSIAVDGSGNYVVVWQSSLQDGSGTGVYGQRFDVNGNTLGSEFQINQTTAGNQQAPQISMTETGEFVVAWESSGQTEDGSGYAVVARRFDASGNALCDEVLVNTTTTNDQSDPAVSILDSGDFVVAWAGEGSGDTDGVFAQRFGAVPLSYTVGDGISDTTVTFTGTISEINTALEGMVYTPDNGFNGVDTLTITVNDQGNTGTGGNLTDADTVSITVGNPNAPVIDLNGADGTTANYTAAWSEGGGPVSLTDATPTLTDGDENLTSLTVTITNLKDGTAESLSANAGATGLTVNYVAATGVLTISGSATAAEYQQVLETVTYNNTSDNPTTTSRIITFTPADALSNGNTASATVTLSGVNDAPVNTAPATWSTSQDTPVVFSTGNGNIISISDADAGDETVEVTLSVNNGTLSLPGLGQETLVNTTTIDIQEAPSIAVATDGSYVVVWEGNLQDGDLYGVFGQRFDASGSPLGDEFQINTETASQQYHPAIAMDAGGNFVVIWQSTSGQDGSLDGIFGQLYDASGVAQGSEFQVNTYTNFAQVWPDVAMDASGNFVVVWSSNLQDGSGFGIYGQRFDATGAAAGIEFQINTETSLNQGVPKVAMDDAGNFTVVWNSDSQDGSGLGVFGQRFDAGGTALGSEFQINTTTADNQSGQDIAMDADGNFVVVWNSNLQDGSSYGVFGQCFNAAGNALGDEFQINSYTTGMQLSPSIAMDASGGFVITYQSYGQDGDNNGTYGRRYASDGTAQGTEFLVNQTTNGVQDDPDVGIDGSGNMIFAWSGEGQGDTSGIFVRNYGGQSVSFSAGDGTDDATMTLSGTITDINTVLDGLTYTPDNGYNGTDSLTITTDDLGNTGTGGNLTDVDTVTITVGNPNAPVTDLDADDSSGRTIGDFETTFTVGDTNIAIVDTDASITDVDDVTLDSMTINISNVLDSGLEELDADNSGTSIGMTFSGNRDWLYLNGTDTLANYLQVLKSVTYTNSAGSPDMTTREITVKVNDGTSDSNIATSYIAFQANASPVITSNGGGATANVNVVENTTAVTTVTSTDADGNQVGYSITGGADAAMFDIDFNTGALTFKSAPDFESPGDADSNNVYEVVVTADDQISTPDTQIISVTVTDVSSNLVVTTTAVTDDGDVSSAEALNSSKGADGFISLNEAIQAANNSSETVTISFNISDPLVNGAHNISVGAGGLPAITGTVIFDGTTDSDYAGDPVIRLDGSSAGAAVNGLTFADGSDGSEVKGLMLTGFSRHGIQVDAGADGITITNNWIGTTGTGSIGVGNNDTGINIQGANTVVGGTGANDGNVITNNGNEGINITGTGATGTVIQGNIIGLDPDGATGSGNADVGIALLSGAHNTTIGGTTAAARNVISNNFEGIEINSNNNIVQGNYIGTDAGGTLDRGNRSDDGVEIKNSAVGNLIGGSEPGAANLISYNALNGVHIVSGNGNTILGNKIHSNGELGINLAGGTEDGYGVTGNDTGPPADIDTGANDLQNYPVLSAVKTDGSTSATINGALSSTASTSFRIEFFASSTFDPSGFGEAERYLGYVDATTDITGSATFSTTLSVSLSVGEYVAATATVIDDPGQVGGDDQLAYGSTSEFSAVVVATTPTNADPVITSNGGGSSATINIAENQTAVTTITATDADADTPTYSITGGTDQALFAIDTNSGVLTFNAAPDFENAGDGNADNVYVVEVTADDGNGGTDTQIISVRVVDAAEGIRVTPTSVVPIGTETLVNTETTDNQLIGANVAQAVATDADGNYVIVWASNLQDGSGWGVYGQMFSADGTAQGSEIQIHTTTTDSQLNPTVAMDDAGNFVVAWQSNLQDGSNYGVYTRYFNSAGVPQGGEVLVNSTTNDYQGSPAIAMASNGDYVVIWTANAQDPDASLGIYGQVYSAGGTPQGGEFRVNTYTTGTQQVTSVSMDDAGNFVVTWASDGQDGSNYGVFAQLFDSNGVAYGSEFQVNTTTDNSQLYNDVAMLSDGRFVVTYQSRNADASVDLFIQRFNADGTKLGSEIQVNAASDTNYFPIPSITADDSGNFTVVWNSSNDGAGNGVFARSYYWSGTALTGEAQVNTTTSGNQTYPDVVAQPGGGYIVVWGGNGIGDTDGVFMQRYGLSTTETGGTTAFEVVLESVPTADVVIPISVSDGSEINISAGSLTFTSGNWDTPQTITVTGLQDYIADGTQICSVILGPAISADPNFDGLDPADLKITNMEVAVAPEITSDGGGATANLNVAENTTAVTTVTATDANEDTVTFSITGGADQALFNIDADTGVLTFSAAHDFESPADINTDNVYIVQVTADDGNGGTDTQTINVTVTNINEGPDQNVQMNENTIVAATMDAGDQDAPPYGIVGGVDSALFSVSHNSVSRTFYLMFNSPPNFESPGDSDLDNVYEVTVNFNDVIYNYFVTVKDANDAPSGLPVITGTVTEDQTLTVDTGGIGDEDGLGSFSYQWLRDESIISGATGTTYTLGDADVGTRISVEVSYTDGFGANETVTSAQTAPVVNINDIPVISLSGTALDYTEGDGAVTVDDGLTLSDVDNTNLTGATVTIAAGFSSSEDTLGWVDQLGITGNYNNSTGILTLSGTTSLANYQTALRTITYTNTSEDPSTANRSIVIQVSDGAASTSDSRTITVTSINDAPIVETNTGITVNEGATSNVITTAMLNEGDPDDSGVDLTYTVTSNTGNGTLRLSGTALNVNDTFTQSQVDAGLVTYDHDGSNTTGDSFGFTLVDGGEDGAAAAAGTFSITITAVDDDAPAQVNNTGSTVAEGGTDTINNTELRYDDSEQTAANVTYTVTSAPANGHLELTGNPGVAVTSFTQAQIDAGQVVYIHDGSNTTSDSFNFSVNDGQGNTLAGQSFALTITAVDDDAPTQVNNTGSTVAEGGTDTISNTELRYDDSEQAAVNVTYTVTSAPANGQLELTSNPGVAVSSFTQTLIDAGQVVYVHDGGNTTSDSFNFSVNDGQGNTLAGQSFALTITAVDDDAPTQVNNTGSAVAEGGTDTISNTELRYDDSEQTAANVTYTVTSSPANGQLELTGNPGVAITSFTQAQIDAEQVVYVHDGSNTTSDSFNFSVNDGQGNILAGQSFALSITAVDDDAPTQVNNNGSTVAEGGTDTISNAELRYDDSEQAEANVTYTVTSAPTNGQLELTGDPGVAVNSFTQAQIDAGLMVYVHDGSNTTSDSFNFSVNDGQGNTLAGQSFALTITAVDDDAPTQVNNTGSTAAEGGTDIINNTELRYDDSEQTAANVTYTVTSSPANGQLELTGNPGVAVTSFTQAQIDAGQVVYVHDGSNTTSDSFNFSVNDGQGNTLAGQSFALTITAVDDDAPTQVNNTGSTVAEGGTDIINNTELRYDDSEQAAANVTYTVTSAPVNGQLELTGNPGVAVTSFTQAQIDAGQVVYVHDGSNTTNDSFIFSVNDGQGNTLAGQSFALTITAVDDDAPIQVNNTGSTIAEGGTDTINNTELRYDDSEQAAANVTFTVTSSPTNGQLELTGNPGVAVTSFTQAQIDSGQVVYIHDGSNTTSDSFNFSVNDGQGNTLAGQSFALTITAVDDDAPTQVNNTGSTIAEGGTDTITNIELRYDDSEQAAANVTYTVTSSPANGQLELTGDPGVAVTSFTQAQIDAGQVVYVHDGSNTTSDSFNFSVNDGQGNTLAGQSFSLTITAVDNNAPTQVNNTGSTVAEGGTDIINNTELRYDDSEQSAANVTYTVTSSPANGQLELSGNPGVAVTSFTQTQIDAGQVVYVHDGSNTTSDSFNFSVNDGQGNTLAGQSFALTITAVDDDAPTQVNNTGSTVAEGGTDTISNAELRYDDSEQAAANVTYTVTSAPANGQLELTGNPGVAVSSFTQAQIDAGQVVYVHDGSNTTSDSFNFSVNDGQGNTLAGQSFALTITAVDDDAPAQVNNTGSAVAEGGIDTISNTELRYDDSEQAAANVTYTVTSAPANGQLELTGNPGVAVSSFTQAQIDAGQLVYVHDGSNTTSDSFNFSVNDGQGNTLSGQSFALTITAVDDDAPTQVNNTGSTVAEGGTDIINNTELRYDDSEQVAANVTYMVTGSPANGQLELTGNPGVAITSFTQEQVDAGQVVYVHDGSNTTSDSFNFSVNDGQSNTLAGQSFALTITAVDDDAPTQVNNTGSAVAEGGTDTINNTELRYDDSEQATANVTYTVTSSPANGQLELTGNPGVAITSFTQAQIDAGQVVYVHDGSNTTSDSFNFNVNDGQGNILAGQSFTLTITAVDDDAPTQVNNTGSTVAEGGTDTISNAELRYDDSEQTAVNITYTVTSSPANGQLELTGSPGVAITSFTQAQIDSGQVVYVHDGSNTTNDSFNFSVNDGQGNNLAGQSFALTITAVDDDAPTQVNNTGSTVAEGGTDTISNIELRYDDSEQAAANVTYTVTSAPANGQLELTGNPGVAVTSFTQAQIDAGEVVYVHDGSNTTSDSFNFNVNDGQGNTLAGQSFALAITAVDDDAPTQVNNNGSTVAEGGTDTISNTELRYDDSEQAAVNVIYTVSSSPTNGQLELTGNPGVAISSFTQAQIDSGQVVYVHDGSNTTSDSFNFSVNDGQGNTLAGQSFALTITAVDDDAPTQVNNTGSTVAEGGTDIINNTELRYDDSEQAAANVTYTVTSAPTNGQLELTGSPGVAVTSFTQAQIDAGQVVYVHDGTNTTSDSFNFSVNDGQGNTFTGQSFALTITAVDDDAPTQVNNTGSIVAEGGTDTISNTELRYDDSEQAAAKVTYTVTSAPANGQLELTGNPGVAVTSFTQAQIDAGQVVYVHDGSNTTSDSFNFSVNDGQGNTLAGQSFALTITAVDDDAPTQVNNNGSTVAEGGTDTISNTELRYDDSEQAAANVTYTVTSTPANGQLELAGNPGVAITSFTQAQIAAGQVVYVHDGSNTTSDSFDFSVNDGQGNILAGQSFALTITAVDDDAPTQVNNTGSTVAEGGTDTISNTELRYDDSEQAAANVTYTVTGSPANGQLELTGNPGVAVSSFTQAQIDAGQVVYVHDGSNTTSDSFNFSVNDGQGNILAGQSFALTITAVDDDAPTQVNNTGSTVAEGGTDAISNTELRYDDSEQAAANVTYTVTSSPANGQLELTGSPGVAVTSFTQAQIDSGQVVYVHDGSNTTSDSFDFSVNDGQGNTLAGQSFALTITAVDDDAPTQVNNTGSTIAEGGTDTISNTELRYDDSEQAAANVTYTVTSAPANGQLELTGNPGVAVTSFTQAQIDAGEVVYVHDGSNTTSDSFNFSVNDGQGNTLAGQSFALTITAVDDDAPTQVDNTGSIVAEGGTDTIRNTELRYVDSEQSAADVTYTVTSTTSNGQLELTGNPGVAVTSFTQAQIDAGDVVYVHNGSNTTSDSFNFSVNDGQGNTLAGQTFTIAITPIDDMAPELVNNAGSIVMEGGTVNITDAQLRYEDSDQPASAVTFLVTERPTHGHLALTDQPGVTVNSFTQAQINAGQLIYIHDGSNSNDDAFSFIVNDGQGNSLSGQRFGLTIIAVDEEPPPDSDTGSNDNNGDGTSEATAPPPPSEIPEMIDIDLPPLPGPVNTDTDEDLFEEIILPLVGEQTHNEIDEDEEGQFSAPHGPTTENDQDIIFLTRDDDPYNDQGKRKNDPSYIFFDHDLHQEIHTANRSLLLASVPQAEEGNSSQEHIDAFEYEDGTSAEPKLNEDYDLLRREIDASFNAEMEDETFRTKIVSISAASFTVGIVSFILRAGSLFASMVSTIPLWNRFDPVAIFTGKNKKKNLKRDSDSNQQISENFFDGDAK